MKKTKQVFFFIKCNAEIAQKGGPSDTYPALQDAILGHGELAWTLVSDRERNDPPADLKNPSNGSKRPYTHTHAANSYWRSLT